MYMPALFTSMSIVPNHAVRGCRVANVTGDGQNVRRLFVMCS
jgi:hypothetical protein